MLGRWVRPIGALGLVVGLVACAGNDDPTAGSRAEASTTTPVPVGSSEAPTSVAPVVPVGFETVTIVVVGPDGSRREWCVYLASTEATRARGLMEVTSLDGHAGMLFRFPARDASAFYMYRTVLPLSIAFFGAAGELVSSADMAPCASDRGVDCPLYSATGAYVDALEVRQGDLAALGVVPGSRLEVTTSGCVPRANPSA